MDYKKLEPVLSEYFDGVKISGMRRDNIGVKLVKTEKSTWRNFYTEKAVYEITENIFVGSRTLIGTTRNHGKLVVRKKKNKLLVDLMTTDKTPDWKSPMKTLENSFEIDLNENVSYSL